MKLCVTARLLALLVVVVMVTTACVASETVIIADAAVESATATALRTTLEADTPTTTDAANPSDASPSLPSPAPATDDVATAADGCVYLGVDSFGDMQIELTLTSTLDTQTDATIDYGVFSAAGDSLVEGAHWIENLAPGERVRISVDTVTDEPAGRTGDRGINCSIFGIDATTFTAQGIAPGANDSCTFIELDSFDDIQIRIDVVAPAEVSAGFAVDYALRGPGGVRFEDHVAFVEEAAAGELSSTTADTFTEFPNWVSESTFTCEILNIQEF